MLKFVIELINYVRFIVNAFKMFHTRARRFLRRGIVKVKDTNAAADSASSAETKWIIHTKNQG